MQRAEPRVVEVQPNTREAKNFVKLERALTCTGKLTGAVADQAQRENFASTGVAIETAQ
jgi:hypothetical protein